MNSGAVGSSVGSLTGDMVCGLGLWNGVNSSMWCLRGDGIQWDDKIGHKGLEVHELLAWEVTVWLAGLLLGCGLRTLNVNPDLPTE